MIALAFFATAVLYFIAGALYLIHLSRGGRALEQGAALVLVLGVVAHVVFLISDCLFSGRILAGDIRQTLAVLSLLIAVGYLAQMRRHSLPALGAFIAPVALLFFLGAGLTGDLAVLPAGVRTAMLPIHVGASTLGVVLFSLAFAVAVSYLIQERLLREKKIGGLFERLPALDLLDALGLKLVTAGFPLFTLGLVTGIVWAVRRGDDFLSFAAPHSFAVLAWLFFAVVLLARVTAGWRGRRAALGTVLGFVCSVATLAGYLLRRLGGS